MKYIDMDAAFKAFQFAAKKHQGQKYPGTELPYITHISNVGAEVLYAVGIEDYYYPLMAVQIAYLHDVLEDTSATYDEITDLFGERVAYGVLCLTKNSTLPKEEQMKDSINRIIKNEFIESHLVKMADRISNLQPPPNTWNKEKIQAYYEESLFIHKQLGYTSSYLSMRLEYKMFQYYFNYLK